MALSDGLLLQVNNGEQWTNRWKHPNDDSDRSTSPSVLRCVASTWKEGLLSRKRPFVGRCCHSCTPQSWEKLFNPSIPSLGLRNVIFINETHTRQRGWLARRLSYVLFVMERDVNKDMFTRNVVDNHVCDVLWSVAGWESAIADVATDLDAAGTQPGQEHKAVRKVKQKARAFLQEMVANISPAFIRLTGWVLLRLFNGFSSGASRSQGKMWPMVFLPVHKSHIDYLLITLILFCHNIKAPHIAAGNNLSIPILSTLIRKLGGFFIRRRMDETGDKKDVLYRSLLHAYTEELLRQQQFLEIYLEGTRSRSGKPSTARAGMLSIVVDTMWTGSIPDVLVVPVGISYDRILEGNYNSEQLGKPKKNESLWGIACGVFRMLRKNYGCVRVDFNQPFSLKRNRHIPPAVSLEQTLMPIIISAQPDAQLFEGQEEEQQNREMPEDIVRRQLINNLAKHVLFTANKHRQGVVLSKLVEDFFNMKEEILSRDFDLGFSGNSEDVVVRALHLLGNCVNVTSSANRNGEFTIAPSQDSTAFSMSSFLMQSSPAASCPCSESWWLNQSLTPPRGSQQPPPQSGELIRKAAGLSHFLVNEVDTGTSKSCPYLNPCQTIYQVFHDAIARLIQYGVLYVAEEDQEELKPLSWRSDEEDEDSDFGEEQRDRYLKVSRLVSPVLEAYSGAAIFVHSLSQPMAESDYTQRLFRYLLTRTERGVKSATHYLVKNT
ncbi:hypothetical protein KUCAC02_027585, partial [Chaenocephalus aceratus]